MSETTINGDGAVQSNSNHSPKQCIYMDDALTQTNFGVFNYFLIIVTGLVMVAKFVDLCAIGYVLPLLDCDMMITSQQKGLLGGIGLLGVSCSLYLWGFFADTMGRKRIIQPCLLFASIASFLSTFIVNFYLFAFLRFINGIFIAATSATMIAYLGEFHSVKYRDRAIVSAVIIFGIVCVLVPILALLIINQNWQFEIPMLGMTYKPWRLFIVLCSFPGIIAWLCLFYMPESPKYVLSQGDQQGAIEIVAEINRRNNGKNAQLNITEIREESESIENRQRILACQKSRFPLLQLIWVQTVLLLKPPYLKSTILTTTLQFGIFYICNGIYIFIVEILNRMMNNVDSFVDDRILMCDAINLHIDNATIAAEIRFDEETCITKLKWKAIGMSCLLETMYAFGFIIVGFFIDRVKKQHIIFAVYIVSSLSAVACMLTDIPIVQMTFFFMFMCIGLVANVLCSVVIELYPTALRAMAINMVMMAGRLGGVIGSNITASLLENYCEYAFYLPGVVFSAFAFLTFFIPDPEQKTNANKARSSIVSLQA